MIDRRTFNAGLAAAPLAAALPLPSVASPVAAVVSAPRRVIKPEYHWFLADYQGLTGKGFDLSDPECIETFDRLAKRLLKAKESIFY
jgi:hypothetical protein